jgi:hypothetical protein
MCSKCEKFCSCYHCEEDGYCDFCNHTIPTKEGVEKFFK